MLVYKQVQPEQLAQYDAIPMLVNIRSIFTVTPADRGLGGLLLQEVPVPVSYTHLTLPTTPYV